MKADQDGEDQLIGVREIHPNYLAISPEFCSDTQLFSKCELLLNIVKYTGKPISCSSSKMRMSGQFIIESLEND
ncbi:unnamed protein product [Adineta ricciae]|uniref:Uncharacterized protein n=1 Tax=Adineta ricciae TaxID=249248 RepID=A0A814W5C2_ADIRI|nr:unnamed protein product [Adineta ricciae]